MLAPLIRWRPAGAPSNDFPDTLCVGRGQILGIEGAGWRDFFKTLQEPAALGDTRHARAEIMDGDHLAACCVRMVRADSPPLWLITLLAPFPSDQLRPLWGLLENLGRRGGGAVLGADALPSARPFTQTLTPPLEGLSAAAVGDLLDDQGMAVKFLRQGEWGALRFHLRESTLLGPFETIRLRIGGRGNAWNSEPTALQPWKSLAPAPGFCIASFAAPWEPGNYYASLVFSGASRKYREATAEIQFAIRPSEVNLAPEGRAVQWQFTGSPPLPLNLLKLNRTAAPRPRLDLSDAGLGSLLHGWHEAEALGGNRFRRWTKSRAAATLGGPGNRLRITLDDYRPRSAADDLTRLVLQIDDRSPTTRDWRLPGRQVFDVPWPEDGLTHQLKLEVTPAWIPKELNFSEDSREFGVLVYSLKVFHGQ